jgi:small-conductance mechanosensitive channel
MKAIQQFAEDMPILYTAIKIILILVVTRVLVEVLKAILKKVEKAGLNKLKKPNKIGYRLLKNVLVTALYILGGVTAVKQVPALSTAVTAILAGSGIIAVAVGFAAQESFGNLVSGVFLSIFRPFDVGDRVQIHSQDITGYIEDITLRHTVIRTILGTRMIVPNSVMGSAVVENTHFMSGEPVRNFVDVEVSYDSDLTVAKRIMEQVVTSHPMYTGPVPLTVFVRSFEASGIALRATMTTRTIDENFIACSEVRQRLKEEFEKNGVTIPFTTVTISNLQELVCNKSDD